jgi:hypothetical protein
LTDLPEKGKEGLEEGLLELWIGLEGDGIEFLGEDFLLDGLGIVGLFVLESGYDRSCKIVQEV